MPENKKNQFPVALIWKNPYLMDKIKSGAQKTFNQITKARREDGRNYIEVINEYFEPYGLEYVVPNLDFINKNIDDIRFALANFRFNDEKRDKIVEKLDFLEFQKQSHQEFSEGKLEKPSKHVLFFHEKNGGWSIVNLFNDNVKLWIELMKKYDFEGDVGNFIDNYFSSRNAIKDLIQAMIDRAEHGEKTISKTWGLGSQVENNFETFLKNDLKRPSEDIKRFSGGGNVIDLMGIDFGIKCSDFYVPVQVKSDLDSAKKSIPKDGISVFPKDGIFYYLISGKSEPQPMDQFYLEVCGEIVS